jgi:ABC-type nitrate/sulfonate/bicarbonate transport system permease component
MLERTALAEPKSPLLTPTRVRLTVLGLLLVTWELAAAGRLVDPFFASSPTRVARALVAFLASSDWYWHLFVSLSEFVLGLVLATAVGVPLGLLMARRPGFKRCLEPFVMALNSTPRAALVPLIVLWFGIGINAKAVVVFLGAVFPIIVTTLAGAQATDQVLIRMARSLDAAERDIFLKVVLPGALPYVLDGVRQGIGRALIGMVVAEMFVSQAGLGNLIMNAAAVLNTDNLIFLAVAISAMGFGLALGVDRLQCKLCPWNVSYRR